MSVCGTVANSITPNEAFLGTWSHELSGPYGALDPNLGLNGEWICLPAGLDWLNWTTIPSPRYPNASPHGSLSAVPEY